MNERRSAIVDVRGTSFAVGQTPDLPDVPDLPDCEPTPRLLVNELPTTTNRTNTTTHAGHRSPRGQRSSSPAGRTRSPLPWIAACLLAGLLALLLLRDHSHSEQSLASNGVVVGTPPITTSSFGSTLPVLGTGNIPVPPVRLVIEIPAGMAGKLRPELPALRRWLSDNEQPTSTMRILLQGPVRKLTPTVTVTHVPSLGRSRSSTIRGTVRWLLAPGHPRPVRVLIGIQQQATPARLRNVRIGTVRLLRTPSVPTATSADLKSSNSIVAAIALQVAYATGQSVQEAPRLARTPSK